MGEVTQAHADSVFPQAETQWITEGSDHKDLLWHMVKLPTDPQSPQQRHHLSWIALPCRGPSLLMWRISLPVFNSALLYWLGSPGPLIKATA